MRFNSATIAACFSGSGSFTAFRQSFCQSCRCLLVITNLPSPQGRNPSKQDLSVDGGNVVQFSRPADTEYINFGLNTVEGYGICDLTTSKSYYDYASDNSGNWEAPVWTKLSPTKIKLVRVTADGIWELTQTITQVKASGSHPGAAQVTMSLKNLSGSTRDAYLLRVADISVNSDHFDNYFDFTWNTALGSFFRPDRLRFGLSLTNNTFTFSHYAFTQNTMVGPDPCQPSAHWNCGLFWGQGTVGQLYHRTVNAGSTMSVTMTYRPM